MARILVDLDGICADIHKSWYKWLKEKHGFETTDAAPLSFDMARCVPDSIGAKAFDCLYMPGFYRNLEPIPGAIEAVKGFYDRGDHVLIVTAAEAPTAHMEKKEWVLEHMPFLSKREFITAHEKWLIQADVLIDDSPRNATDFRAAQPDAFIATLAYPYNANCTAYNIRAENRQGPGSAWEFLSTMIRMNVGMEG